ncbi:LysR family transcriptional regulator [Marisediminitalea sp.]|jgi:LysR family transcriptional regulator for metE and metH|uniref:LysR family transcriptional regulator n=1 Tax=Marisediminitalea sp. TaxID=2662268 RepID=UPI00243D4442
MLERIHLAILHAIDKHGTLTQAADALHLSQSALSHSIKKLEQQMNTPLWEKEGRRLRLTRAGTEVLKLAKRVLPQFEHTELLVSQIAQGERGMLRIGMECHPCYQWLLKVVSPFLDEWPDVDIDVKQAFQFGGMAALFEYDIDMLVTPDPLFKPGVTFTPVFSYEHRLVVASSHPLAQHTYVSPEQLQNEVLITYPVEPQRLDIFSQFLTPAGCTVKQHKTIETTEIMLQMVAASRCVCALPGWLVDEYASRLPITSLAIGKTGIHKHIYVGVREVDTHIPYVEDFIRMASATDS